MLKDKIIHSPYIKKVATLFSATFVGQVLPFLFYPVLSRVYSPGEYSLLGIYILLISAFGAIGTLKLDQALLIPETDNQAIQLAKNATLSLIGIVTALSLVLKLVTDYSWNFVLLLVLGSFAHGIALIYLQLSNRLNFNKTVAMHKVSIGIGVSLLQTAFSSFTIGLVSGKTLGDWISISFFINRFFARIKQAQLETWRFIWSTYHRFALITLPHTLFNLFGNRLPVLVFAYLGFSSLSGEYENVFRLGMAPISVIAQALYLSFSARFSEIHRDGKDVLPFFIKNFKWTALVVVPPFLIVSITAPFTIPLFLGEQWVNSGNYFLYLSPLMIATVLTSPFVYIPQYVQKQKEAFLLELLINAFKLSGLFIGLQWSPNWGVLLFSLFGAFGYAIFMFYVFKLVKQLSVNVVSN